MLKYHVVVRTFQQVRNIWKSELYIVSLVCLECGVFVVFVYIGNNRMGIDRDYICSRSQESSVHSPIVSIFGGTYSHGTPAFHDTMLSGCGDGGDVKSEESGVAHNFFILFNVQNLGVTPIDQIKLGQRLEVQHELAPRSVWIVRVLENVGGRLLLRYEGTDRAVHDFWLFYIHHRLHPMGWAKEHDCIYTPPDSMWSVDYCNSWIV